MWPPSGLAESRGRNARVPWITPIRLTPSIHCQSAGVISAIGAVEPTPALLQITCTRPNRPRTSSARAWTLGMELTSAGIPMAPISAAVRTRAAASTSAMTTCIPSAISAWAMPRPMPDAPPVTTAVLPASSFRALIQLSPCGGA